MSVEAVEEMCKCMVVVWKEVEGHTEERKVGEKAGNEEEEGG